MRRLIGGVAGIVVIGGLGLGWKFFLATPVGGNCSDASECRGLSSECLQDSTGSYCTEKCAGSPDCPAGWSCTSAESAQAPTGTTAVCARPFAGAPAIPVTGLPATAQ